MKLDLMQFHKIFDKMLSSTNEEIGYYWFQFTRNDRVSIKCIFSKYEDYVQIIVDVNPGAVGFSISLEGCSEIRISEQEKLVEILSESKEVRCTLSLLGDLILEYME